MIMNKKLNTYSKSILKIFLKSPKKSYNYKQIISRLTDKNERFLKQSIEYLIVEKNIIKISPGNFVLNKKKFINGLVDKTKKGSGYLITEELENDLYISYKNIGNALNGDKVICSFINHREVKVIDIIKRKKEKYVGVVYEENNKKIIEYNSNKDNLIFITKNKEIKKNEIVVFEILKWDDDEPEIKIIKKLGVKGEVNNEIHAILEEYELPYNFDDIHIKEALKLKHYQNSKEDLKRKDLTNITTFTIDPSDAKDFDDAISVREINKNETEIGVHIADVSHFLKANTLLDLEGKKRATSVYLVDRVVPMLPEEISNNLCSLNPKENKYCFSVLFIFRNNEIVKHSFCKTIINSNERLSYREAQYIIENKTNNIPKEVSLQNKTKTIEKNVADSICLINNIAKYLRKKRYKNGSISFNKTEINFVLNKNKEPVSVEIKTSSSANKLIEEFMLLANQKAAELFSTEKRGLFRIHDFPDDKKIAILETIVKKLGYKQNFKIQQNLNKELNSLLLKAENTPEKNLIDTLVIRSMSKAKYSTKNIGHFGLNFEKYTHFTSPIRRYPDVLVHREIENILLKNNKKTQLEDVCLHCSQKEEIATKAERSSIKFMQVKFMSTKINKIYKGVISGINERGIFVEVVENKCEGFIKIKDVPGDYYVFIEKDLLLLGRHTKVEYRLGDEVLVKVLGVNERKQQIDFSLQEKM